ncbi:MAG: ABC transporter permease [Chloroflexota bacterium]
MIIKNLLRRKGRTLLTIFGISVGVTAIIGLGALADGLKVGYDAILTGSKADLILSQPNAIDISLTTVNESVGNDLADMPEVAAVSGMLQGIVQTENIPYFFLYGYPKDSFILSRFHLVEGLSIDSHEARRARGKPLLLGASAAEALGKQVGDTLRIMDSTFRIVGLYETGETLEDNGAVILLSDAQVLLGKPQQVNFFYIQLKDASMRERIEHRVAMRWPDLELSSTEDFSDKQVMGDMVEVSVWGIAGLAIVVGSVGMMNSQLMAVIERTREIGALRSVGWSSYRVLWMILSESLLVGLLGGLLGIGFGWLAISSFSNVVGFFGATTANIRPEMLGQALVLVLVMGFIGGAYPAWRASRLLPIEALRYEGGTSGRNVRRLPVGGMAVQSLWQRTTRTLLTLGAICLTVGGIIAIEAIVRGIAVTVPEMSGNAEIMIRQAGVADTEFSAIDERTGDKIAAIPEVAYVSGVGFTGTILPDSGVLFILFGYAPNEYAIQRFNVVEGKKLTGNHQIMLGSMIAKTLGKEIGDILELGGGRFKVMGIYESGMAWEEMGGVISLRDAQTFMGRPRKVTMYMVKVHDPSHAQALVGKINELYPEVHASLSGEFAEQMPDMQTMDGLMAAISFLAILVGGVGVMNTMLMAVLERTREIGVLRASGWSRQRVLSMILQESLILGLLGGIIGIGVAFGLIFLLNLMPLYGSLIVPKWEVDVFSRAILIALFLGLLGGLYPAYRATRIQPVEALRYE